MKPRPLCAVLATVMLLLHQKFIDREHLINPQLSDSSVPVLAFSIDDVLLKIHRESTCMVVFRGDFQSSATKLAGLPR